MITAIVLIKTSMDRIPEIAEQIAALDSVSEVFSVTGTYDLIAMVRVREHEDLAEVIPGSISKIPGVEGTDTHVAFRTYSQHDLEAAFAIGLDNGPPGAPPRTPLRTRQGRRTVRRAPTCPGRNARPPSGTSTAPRPAQAPAPPARTARHVPPACRRRS